MLSKMKLALLGAHGGFLKASRLRGTSVVSMSDLAMGVEA
jgi:hypothetical protein